MSMDLDAAVPIRTIQHHQAATILCCNCGAPIDGTVSAGALCYDCIKLTIDITEGIQREGSLHTCRDCERWLSPPSQWVTAALESRELLALCLRKLRGLNKIRIIDANFIWTEPHSKRIKLKITVQQEAFEGTILQQTFEVEYVVASQQCPDCAKSFTANVWRASVQVRQKVPHKRTFLYLEQLILKHSAHKDTINIKEVKDGLDFFFSQRNQAEKFVDFLTSVAPVKLKKSQELISMDIHTSTKSYKFTFSCELIPICKDDLVALPTKLAKQIGNISPLTLCYRVGTSINLLDPRTLQTADLPANVYWRSPFKSLADVSELVEFVVLDIEPLGSQTGRHILAEATIARAADLGVNDTTYYTRTHLGGILHAGDSVLGYHITRTNFNNPQFEVLENSDSQASQIPDVVLVKKFYARKNKAKSRSWRLKRMARKAGDEEATANTGGRRGREEQDKAEADYEMFLRDVEEDEELRATMALYRAKQQQQQSKQKQGGKKVVEAMDVDVDEQKSVDETSGAEDNDGDDDEGEVPKIDMNQLLDDFDELSVGDVDEEI